MECLIFCRLGGFSSYQIQPPHSLLTYKITSTLDEGPATGKNSTFKCELGIACAEEI